MTGAPWEDGLVSVVTPAHNAARTIDETIASVQNQTYARWEMLVVDDASRDDTSERVNARASRDARIRPFRSDVNLGPAGARNRALENARGRYMAFLDSDDLWLPGKLECQLRFMEERKAALSYTQYRRMSSDGSRVRRVLPVPRIMTYHRLLRNSAIATSTVILDRRQTGDVRLTPGFGYDDFILWLSLLKRGIRAHGLQRDLMKYRVLDGSVSGNKARAARWVWTIYRRVEKLPLDYALWCFVPWALRAAWKRLG